MCAPDLGIIGELCTSNAECASGVCALSGAEGTCSRLCSAEDLCGSGYECVRVDTNNAVCLPAAVEEEPRKKGGCSAGGGTPAGALAFVMAIVFAARRRRD